MDIQKFTILKISRILDALLKMGAILLVMIGIGATIAIIVAPTLNTSFIFKRIKHENTPFAKKNVNRLKLISFLIIAIFTF